MNNADRGLLVKKSALHAIESTLNHHLHAQSAITFMTAAATNDSD